MSSRREYRPRDENKKLKDSGSRSKKNIKPKSDEILESLYDDVKNVPEKIDEITKLIDPKETYDSSTSVSDAERTKRKTHKKSKKKSPRRSKHKSSKRKRRESSEDITKLKKEENEHEAKSNKAYKSELEVTDAIARMMDEEDDMPAGADFETLTEERGRVVVDRTKPSVVRNSHPRTYPNEESFPLSKKSRTKDTSNKPTTSILRSSLLPRNINIQLKTKELPKEEKTPTPDRSQRESTSQKLKENQQRDEMVSSWRKKSEPKLKAIKYEVREILRTPPQEGELTSGAEADDDDKRLDSSKKKKKHKKHKKEKKEKKRLKEKEKVLKRHSQASPPSKRQKIDKPSDSRRIKSSRDSSLRSWSRSRSPHSNTHASPKRRHQSRSPSRETIRSDTSRSSRSRSVEGRPQKFDIRRQLQTRRRIILSAPWRQRVDNLVRSSITNAHRRGRGGFMRLPFDPRAERGRGGMRPRGRGGILYRSSSKPFCQEDYMDKFGRLDKKKLLEIATKNATKLAMEGKLPRGAELLDTIKNKSVEQLVSLCKQLQEERDALEKISSSDEEERYDRRFESWRRAKLEREDRDDDFVPRSVKPANEIKINISSRQIDEKRLRLNFPVSSGAQHRCKLTSEDDWDLDKKQIVSLGEIGPLTTALSRVRTNIPSAYRPLALDAPPSLVTNLSTSFTTASSLKPPPTPPKLTTSSLPKLAPPPEPPKLEPLLKSNAYNIACEALKKANSALDSSSNINEASTSAAISAIPQPTSPLLLPPPPTPPVLSSWDTPGHLMMAKREELLRKVAEQKRAGAQLAVSNTSGTSTPQILPPPPTPPIVEATPILDCDATVQTVTIQTQAQHHEPSATLIPTLSVASTPDSERGAHPNESLDEPPKPETETINQGSAQNDKSDSGSQIINEEDDCNQKIDSNDITNGSTPLISAETSANDSERITISKFVAAELSNPLSSSASDGSFFSPSPSLLSSTHSKTANQATENSETRNTAFLTASSSDIGPKLPFHMIATSDPNPGSSDFLSRLDTLVAHQVARAKASSELQATILSAQLALPAPPKKELVKASSIFREPIGLTKVPKNITELVAQRLKYTEKLKYDPNDFHARQRISEIEDEISVWAQGSTEPGLFTGSTGASVLSEEELQPSHPKYHAWAKKDQLKDAPEISSGVGMKLLQKMGWKPGMGLGKDAAGPLEPLTLDIKSDRRGLKAFNDKKISLREGAVDSSGKNPVSVLMEYCAHKRLMHPQFSCKEMGPQNDKRFLWKAIFNGVEYEPSLPSTNKKAGKAQVCMVILEAMGLTT